MFDDIIDEGDFGPDIKPKLATRIANTWQMPLQKLKIKEKLEKTKIPKNCSFLLTKRTNEEIYRELLQQVIGKDARTQKQQKLLAIARRSIYGPEMCNFFKYEIGPCI